jgi:predicted house-cleaning noncanonical NTP pyrophosphatase (MazG superfamily)
MGKKRRILRSPKFKHLRKHRKYSGLVKAKVEEAVEEVVEEAVEEEIQESIEEIVTPILEVKPKATIEKPKPKSRRTRKGATTRRKTKQIE